MFSRIRGPLQRLCHCTLSDGESYVAFANGGEARRVEGVDFVSDQLWMEGETQTSRGVQNRNPTKSAPLLSVIKLDTDRPDQIQRCKDPDQASNLAST